VRSSIGIGELSIQDDITRRIASGLGTELIETEARLAPPAADPPQATIREAARDQAGRRQITALACELIVPGPTLYQPPAFI